MKLTLRMAEESPLLNWNCKCQQLGEWQWELGNGEWDAGCGLWDAECNAPHGKWKSKARTYACNEPENIRKRPM